MNTINRQPRPSSAAVKGENCDFRLRDYLQPGGWRPYEMLPKDMEAAFARGLHVYLWSVPGFLMVSGHPDLLEERKWWRDWCGETTAYKTAADAIRMERGRRLEI